MPRLPDTLAPELWRGAGEAAERLGVELGGDEDKDVVAQVGQRRTKLRLRCVIPVCGYP